MTDVTLTADTDFTARRPERAWLACIWAYGSVVAMAALCESWGGWALYLPAVLFISARQHTLYVLNHDASHGNLFESPAMNRRFGKLFCVFPFLHHPEAFSFVLWRRIHRAHHAMLFTKDDPNFVGRQERGDTLDPPRGRKLLLSVLSAPVEALKNFFVGRQDYLGPDSPSSWNGKRLSHQGLLWRPLQNDPELERERREKLLFFLLGGVAVVWAGGFVLLVKYWIIPMYTVYPAILRLMDLTEHNWSETSGMLGKQANSRALSPAARLFVSDLRRELHWEHHLKPAVPFHRLREFSQWLRQQEGGSQPSGQGPL